MKAALQALALAGCLLLPGTATAVDADRAVARARPTDAAVPPPAGFAVEAGGRHVATLRARMLGFSAEERARGASERIAAAFEKNANPRFATRTAREGTQVLADGAPMFLIAHDDVNMTAGETPDSEGARALDALRVARGQRAEMHDSESILRGAGLALVATLVGILLWRLLFALDRKVGVALSRRVAQHVRELKLSGVQVLDHGYTLRLVRQVVRWTTWILAAALTYLWLNAVLESLPFTRPWGDKLTAALVETMLGAARAFLEALPGLVFVVVILAIARLAAQVAGFFFERIIDRDLEVGWLDRHTARPTRMIVVLLIWVLAAAMAYPYFPGSDSRAFQGISVLLGVMVSLGASNIVGQAAAGLILMYTRAFQPGEYVRLQDTEGTVVQVGLFATRVRTGLGDEVMLPNNFVLSNVSRNYSSDDEDAFTIMTGVNIGYEVPWQRVHELLEAAAKRTAGVLAEPRPRIYQSALNDFYVEYKMAVRSLEREAAARADVVSRLRAAILDAFHEAGVQVMSPHYGMGDPARPKIAPVAATAPAPTGT